MKTSNESISTKSESSTIALPRGFQIASSSAVAPGIFKVTTNSKSTAPRKIPAFRGCRL